MDNVVYPDSYDPKDPLFSNRPPERWELERLEVMASYDGWSHHPDGEAILNYW